MDIKIEQSWRELLEEEFKKDYFTNLVEFVKQDITGLYQLCPNDKISKFELLKLFAKVWDKALEVTPFDDYHVDKSLVCTRTEFDYPIPEFEKMLRETKQWMEDHPANYSHY